MSQNLAEEIFVVFLGSLGRRFLDCCHRLFPSKLKQPFMAARPRSLVLEPILIRFRLPVDCNTRTRARRSPRAVFSYRGAGKVRRRSRRRVRRRVFSNARTATRNLDLPLAIGRSPSHPQPVYCIGGFRRVYGGNTAGFSSVRRLCRRVDSALIPFEEEAAA